MQNTKKIYLIFVLCYFLSLVTFAQQTLLVSANSNKRIPGEVEADYTTTKLFVDEIQGDTIPMTFFFDPQTNNVETAEIFTNLNRRDRAAMDADGDGIHDGIVFPNGNNIHAGDDSHYFKAYTMSVGSGGYYLTLDAEKTGVYRVTARYRLVGDDPNTYRWYEGRDHAIVVSPMAARDIRMYEVNVLNVAASGTDFENRSTFEDLSGRPGAIHTDPNRPNVWNLDYIKNLGVNWLWFQPYHPYGWEGRHLSAHNINERDPGAEFTTWIWNNGDPYEDVNFFYQLGSPYAVKNFWEIEPRMTATFVGDPSNFNDVNDPENRERAMIAFQNFVADADAAGIRIMPDAAFNHTAWDVELGEAGIKTTQDNNPNVSWMAAQGASGWQATDTVHSREVRVFSRDGDYRRRASFYNDFFDNNIASAPDRTDFGKWLDVIDIFFGRYAALVGTQDGTQQDNYLNEQDWFDYSEHEYGRDPNNPDSGGSFDAITRATWWYFAQYAPYWLEKTRPEGQNRNSETEPGLTDEERYEWDRRGIDGLRCDFGQGLPPQAWEYIINVARSYKWKFVFMAETLDSGPPSYRSNRQFDILNENLFSAARGASTHNDFVSILESRRNAFGQGLVLLNTSSHDEDNFVNPWDAFIRFALFSTIDGAPMIFPGQELGISEFFGYDLMELNFGKFIPHFKTYNSMMPIWTNTDFGNRQLFHTYSAVNHAREFSSALRSSNRWFLNGDGNNQNIYAVAKYDTPNVFTAFQDVVLGFVNLTPESSQQDNFKISEPLADLLGLTQGRDYNVRNIAAYLNEDIGMSGRRDNFLWPQNYSRDHLINTGFFVGLNRVPTIPTTSDPVESTSDPAWNQNPFEAQYLKLYDVTPPPGISSAPATVNELNYTATGELIMTWDTSFGSHDNVVANQVVITAADENILFDDTLSGTSAFAWTVPSEYFGETVTVTVRPVSIAGIAAETFSESSQPVVLLDPDGDEDNNGMTNFQEFIAGTDPFDPASALRADNIALSGTNPQVSFKGMAGRRYRLEYSEDFMTGAAEPSWIPASDWFVAEDGEEIDLEDESEEITSRVYRIVVELN